MWELHFSFLFSSSERGRLSLGPFLGGHPHDDLLFHGPSLVRGCYRHLHCAHRLTEDGDADVGTRRAAQIPWCEVNRVFRPHWGKYDCCSCYLQFNKDTAERALEPSWFLINPSNNSMVHWLMSYILYSPFSREQRVTGIFVFILTGLSVFMAPILKVLHELINSSVKVRITVRCP